VASSSATSIGAPAPAHAWREGPTGEHDLYSEPVGLAGWLARWLDGTLRQPCLFQDPVTGQWHGMTDEDWGRLEPYAGPVPRRRTSISTTGNSHWVA